MLRPILIFLVAYIFTFVWFWPTAVILVTGKPDGASACPRLELSPRCVAFIIAGIFYWAVGLVLAALGSLSILLLMRFGP